VLRIFQVPAQPNDPNAIGDRDNVFGVKYYRRRRSPRAQIAVTVGAVLATAVSDGLIVTNPALMTRTTRPPSLAARKAARPGMTVWTERKLEMFLLWLRDKKCDPEYPLWKLYAATGARRSELLALHFSDLDLKAWKLHIRRTLDLEDPDRKMAKQGPCRALSPSAVTVLRQWRRLLASRDINAVKPAAWLFPFDADLSRPRNPDGGDGAGGVDHRHCAVEDFGWPSEIRVHRGCPRARQPTCRPPGERRPKHGSGIPATPQRQTFENDVGGDLGIRVLIPAKASASVVASHDNDGCSSTRPTHSLSSSGHSTR